MLCLLIENVGLLDLPCNRTTDLYEVEEEELECVDDEAIHEECEYPLLLLPQPQVFLPRLVVYG
jgi:hypothetical protein